MKTNRYIATIFITTILFACNNNSSSKDNAVAEEHQLIEPSNAETLSTICYGLKNATDTVLMKLKMDNGHTYGDLMYHYFEKDKNTGTLQGKMNGDTLFANYTFMSEGKESVRPVVFLIKGDEITEGYGNLNPATGEPDFTDRSAIKFDNKFVLKKTDCE